MQRRSNNGTDRRSFVPDLIIRFYTSTKSFIQKHLIRYRSPKVESILRFVHASFHLASAMESTVDLYFGTQVWPKSVDEQLRASLILMKVTFDLRRATYLFNFTKRSLGDFDCLHHHLCVILLLLKIHYFVSIILYDAKFKGSALIPFLEKLNMYDRLFLSIAFGSRR